MSESPTFAEQMLAKIEAVLLEAAGVKSAVIAGQTVSYDDLIAQRDHWRREIQKERGTRPLMVEVHMGGV